MQIPKLFDSELRVMNLLWAHGELTARELASRLGESVGWNINTTYTVIKKCVAKGLVERTEPGFRCRALISRREAQLSETSELIDKLYEGAAEQLVACLLDSKRISAEELAGLRRLVEESES